jgi:hypothetical protein
VERRAGRNWMAAARALGAGNGAAAGESGRTPSVARPAPPLPQSRSRRAKRASAHAADVLPDASRDGVGLAEVLRLPEPMLARVSARKKFL